jgi:acyl-CoA synthetase (AMP-forming)/AMP-acid ligase II
MYLIDMIFYWAKTDPHRHALIQPEMVTTYQALADAIESTVDRIEQLGLDRREAVGVSVANPSLFIVVALALLRSGYSVALVKPALLPLLHSAGIRNLIYDTQGLMLSGGRNIRFDPSWLSSARQNGAGRAYRKPPIKNADVILFTSGTTGLPKKVIQPSAALDQLLKYPLTCASGIGQKILIMPGLTTTFGFNRLCEVLNVGKSACFASDSESALSLIGLFGAEVVVASAAQAMSLAEIKNKNPGYQVDSLKAIFVGGGKIEPEGIASIRAALCRNIINQYGSTEAGVAALTPFDLLADRPGAIALPWTELQIVDETGQQLPAGTEGLIRYRTPQLVENIKRAGPDNIPGVRDGWFYPGDIGSLTAGGVLNLAGRSSDVINRGGVKVSGTRIEEILKALPQIKEAAACGIAGPSGLEEIWIAVVANGPVHIEEIEELLRNHADIGIAPDEVFVLDELPRGELGKVQKFRLKELLLRRKRIA